MARLSAIFGIVALALAAVGLYGVVAYTVATRRSEIGVRMALIGAGRGRILGMMMADTGAMLAVGLAAGAAAALAGAGLFGTLLYGAPSNAGGLATAGSRARRRGSPRRGASGPPRGVDQSSRGVARIVIH